MPEDVELEDLQRFQAIEQCKITYPHKQHQRKIREA
jgi:hypothetical protein